MSDVDTATPGHEDTVEFLSPAWFQLIADLIDTEVRSVDLGDRPITISEVFTDVPPHLVPGGTGTRLAWHFRLSTGQAEIGSGTAPDSDLHTEVSYPTALEGARMLYTADNAADIARYREEAIRAGTFRRTGDESRFPPAVLSALIGVHNSMAVRTRG
jgi:hypothetical protein